MCLVKLWQIIHPSSYYSRKYPSAPIFYKGRWLPKNTPIILDVRYFFTNPVCYDVQKIASEFKGSDDEKATAALEWVRQNILYLPDKWQFGLEDLWLFPYETLALKKGDCEDGAILLANLLVAAGIPAWRVRLSCMTRHIYLTYYSKSRKWIILDWTTSENPSWLGEVIFSWTRNESYYGDFEADRGTLEVNVPGGKVLIEQ